MAALLAANLLVAFVASSQDLHRRLDDTTTETAEADLEGAVVLDIIIAKTALIFELLSTMNDTNLAAG